MTKINNSYIKNISALYSQPLPSSRSGVLYNAFSYPTKISPEVIAIFIAAHTKPGANILDVFGGSGTTGTATLLCDKPTESMLKMVSELGIEVEWGPRHAEIYELSTLGSFISNTLTSAPNPDEFEKELSIILTEAEKKIGWVYHAESPQGEVGKIRYTVWSDVLVCHNCSNEITYWDASVRREPLKLDDRFICPQCALDIQIKKCTRATNDIFDSLLNKNVKLKKRVLVHVYGTSEGKNWSRPPSESDVNLYEQVSKQGLPSCAPNAEIYWGDLYRSGYHNGITHLHHFYTDRNFLVFSTLWDLALQAPESVRDAIKLAILSYNSSHSTLMTRIVVKKGQNDFVLTGAQSGVLYVSGLPVEKNILDGVKRKGKTIKRAFETVSGSESSVNVTNDSSTSLALLDASIDYVFTDPPFGDYIPYAEINQINEYWLGKTTNKSEEIIISNAQDRNVENYSELMQKVFKEVTRVMKADGLATIVFHSAHSKIWRALTQSYINAGLSVKATSVLDKLQSSFKQVVSNISVKGDPLILLSKEKNQCHTDLPTKEAIIKVIIEENKAFNAAENNTQRIYSLFIGKCLELGVPIDIEAKEFYSYINTNYGIDR